MSIIRVAVTAATIARTVVLHPAFQAGLALAPVLLTPEVRAKARDAVLAGAHGAGVWRAGSLTARSGVEPPHSCSGR